MDAEPEPDWVTAKREADRQFRVIPIGMGLACVAIALTILLLSNLQHHLAIRLGGALMLTLSVGSLMLWRRSPTGSIYRSFSVTLGALSLFGCLVLFFSTGV